MQCPDRSGWWRRRTCSAHRTTPAPGTSASRDPSPAQLVPSGAGERRGARCSVQPKGLQALGEFVVRTKLGSLLSPSKCLSCAFLLFPDNVLCRKAKAVPGAAPRHGRPWGSPAPAP